MKRHLLVLVCGLTLAIGLPLSSAANEHDHEGEGHGHEEEGHDEHGHGEKGHDEHGHGEQGHEEGKVNASPEALKESGVVIEEAKPARIAVSLSLSGQVTPVEGKVLHLTPRFPGVLKSVRKELGENVKAGETVAVIESNQSLQRYEAKSEVDGIVTKRHATVGEYVSEGSELFEIVDLSELNADFFAFAPHFSKINPGQAVVLTYQGVALDERASVTFISPLVDEFTQSKLIRARISNVHRHFSPGAFVTGEVVLEEIDVPIAVRSDAIQTHEGKPVVFVKSGDAFEPRPVKIGRADRKYTEIVSGFRVGEKYAAGNSFILKAELGKEGAEHEH